MALPKKEWKNLAFVAALSVIFALTVFGLFVIKDRFHAKLASQSRECMDLEWAENRLYGATMDTLGMRLGVHNDAVVNIQAEYFFGAGKKTCPKDYQYLGTYLKWTLAYLSKVAGGQTYLAQEFPEVDEAWSQYILAREAVFKKQ